MHNRNWGAVWLSRLLLLASVVWIGVVAYFALRAWPTIPLDMSPNDPATKAAYDTAVRAHVIQNGLLGLVPAVFIYVIARFIVRRR